MILLKAIWQHKGRTIETVMDLNPGISPWGMCGKEIIPQKQNIYMQENVHLQQLHNNSYKMSLKDNYMYKTVMKLFSKL